MQIQPLVSAIIPTKDRHEDVVRAAASVHAQTYPHLELIVIDDGSERPVSLGEIEGRVPVQLIRQSPSQGAAAARNVAVAHASGDYLALLDDDDRWYPEKIQRQMDVLLKCPSGVAVVDSGYELWDGDHLVYRFIPDPARELPRAVLKEATIAPSTAIIRREALLDLGGFVEGEEFERVEDWLLWLRLAQRYGAVSVDQVLAYRRANYLPAADVIRHRQVAIGEVSPFLGQLPRVESLRLRLYHAAVLAAARARLVIGDERWLRIKRLARDGYRRVRWSATKNASPPRSW
jgi:glycosyltransferase involved in cell wall biosynthesis